MTSLERISNENPSDQLTYEEAFMRLEQIVATLESEEHTLDEALSLFEQGQMLANYCSSLLEQAELRIKIITGEETTDFTPDL